MSIADVITSGPALDNVNNIFVKFGLGVSSAEESKSAPDVLFVHVPGRKESESAHQLIVDKRKAYPAVFIIVFSPKCQDDVRLREFFVTAGANMVTDCLSSLELVVQRLAFVFRSRTAEKLFKCSLCGIKLSEEGLSQHVQMQHVAEARAHHSKVPCSVCKVPVKRYMWHMHNEHPLESHEPEQRIKKIALFALVVCRRKSDGKFLLVQELGEQGWWLPGGGVDSGESFQDGAIRETKEEAGIDVKLTGVLKVMFSPDHQVNRMKVIFLAEPWSEDQLPKSIPDSESVGAAWVDVQDVDGNRFPLRGHEPHKWFNYVADGKPVMPMSFLSREH